MPAIMDQQGYTTAAFHGDVGSFGIAIIPINLGDINISLVKTTTRINPTIVLAMV